MNYVSFLVVHGKDKLRCVINLDHIAWIRSYSNIMHLKYSDGEEISIGLKDASPTFFVDDEQEYTGIKLLFRAKGVEVDSELKEVI